MIENRGGCGLYFSPSETQVVARRVAENTISARTPMVKLLETEYSLPAIQMVLSELLPDHPEITSTLGDYAEGEECVKAAIDLLPKQRINQSPSVVGNFIVAVAVEGIAERFAYRYTSDGHTHIGRLLKELPKETQDYVAFTREVFMNDVFYLAHMKWFFRDMVGRVKDVIIDNASFEENATPHHWLSISVGEPFYLAAAECLPASLLRTTCQHLFQESQQGLYPYEEEEE